MSETARRRGDPRIFLVGLAFLAAAGFLGLHALATPGVLLEKGNAGFTIATPVGLVNAAVLAVASSLDLSGSFGRAVIRGQNILRAALVVLLVAWGVASLASLPPLDNPLTPEEAEGPLRFAALVGVGALRDRRDPLPAAVPDDARAASARGPHLVDPARRGDGRRRVRPQLAAVVVGVAPADGDRVRARRLGRPVAAATPTRRVGRSRRSISTRPSRARTPPTRTRSDSSSTSARTRTTSRGSSG